MGVREGRGDTMTGTPAVMFDLKLYRIDTVCSSVVTCVPHRK